MKKWLQHRYFPVNIAKFLRTPILKNICERLLLYCQIYMRCIQLKFSLRKYETLYPTSCADGLDDIFACLIISKFLVTQQLLNSTQRQNIRSGHPGVVCKIAELKNSGNSYENTCDRTTTLLKHGLLYCCFPGTDSILYSILFRFGFFM